MNKTRPDTHKFLVLAFCRLHNESIDSGLTRHITPAGAPVPSRASAPNQCSIQKRPAAKRPAANAAAGGSTKRRRVRT